MNKEIALKITLLMGRGVILLLTFIALEAIILIAGYQLLDLLYEWVLSGT